jgi:adenylylsulfate kinase-like enzyme
MPDLIVVSGSINAGKSTVSRLLVERLHQRRRRAAHVQGDALRHFVTQLPLEDAVPVTLQNIIAVSKTFLVADFDVVVDYPFYRPSYERLREALAGRATAVHAFVLSPPLEVAQGQRGERVLSPHEAERVAHHYRTGLHNPGFGVCLDNARQTPQETVELILRHLGR